MTPCPIRIVGFILLAVGMAGCTQVEGTAMYGNEKSVAVRYYGDLDTAILPARQYCAQYGRTAEYIGSAEHMAQFDCVAR